MGQTLMEIAQKLKSSQKKVQLIYAFNSTGKTRLSREFKQLIAPKSDGIEDDDEFGNPKLSRHKILYYNAFTEDLFYWDNDLGLDAEPKLKIQPNAYTNWLVTLLRILGQDGNIVRYFQRYANDKLTPRFSEDLTEVTFSFERGDIEHSGPIKISKAEESNFIWSVFYALLDQVVSVLNAAEPDQRETREFDQLEYVFIDDPVSSLDENHLIELAVDLAKLIKDSASDLKFIVTTHSPLFYNVLYSELKSCSVYLLKRCDDGTFVLEPKRGDSNRSFSYHLYLKQTIEQAIVTDQVERYHFMLLRNLYEKTASFLGYQHWSDLLPDEKELYLKRILNFTSHSTLSVDAVAEPTPEEKKTVEYLLNYLKTTYRYSHTAEGDKTK